MTEDDENDIRILLKESLKFIKIMVDCCAALNNLKSSLLVMILNQMIVQ